MNRHTLSLATRWVGALCLFYVSAQTAPAATYYVRTGGNDRNDGLSPAKAFRSINKPRDILQPGDVVYVGAGTYKEMLQLYRNGTKAKPIQYVADTDGSRTGDAGDVVVQSNDQFAMIRKGAYNHVIGFKFRGGRQAGVLFYGNSRPGGLLKDCEVSGSSGDGLRVSNAMFDLSIENCTFQGHNGWGMRTESTYSTVTLVGCTFSGNRLGGILTDVSSSPNYESIQFKRCVIAGNRGHGAQLKTGKIQFENCLIRNNSDEGIVTGSSGKASAVHCTIVFSGDDGVDADKGYITVLNSIVAYNGDDGLDGSKSTLTHDYNVVYGNRDDNFSGVAANTNESQADPGFVDAAKGDYHLRSGSPAVDRALTVAPPIQNDLDGNTRPVGAANDIGCYESGSLVLTGAYFVRVTGNDKNNGLTPLTAFRTVSKAASVVKAGDVVYVGAGTYTESVPFTRSGTKDKPIHFIADATGSKTTDAGPVRIVPTSSTWNALIRRAVYLELEGFEFPGATSKGTAYGLYVKDSEEIRFTNCVFRQTVYGVYAAPAVKNVYIVDSQFHNCNMAIGLVNRIKNPNDQHLLISGCTIQAAGGYGIYALQDSRVALEKSTITFSRRSGYGVYANQARQLLLRNTTVRGSAYGVFAYGEDIQVSDSVCSENSYGLYVFATGKTDVKLARCIAEKNSGGLILRGSRYDYDNVVVRNNQIGIYVAQVPEVFKLTSSDSVQLIANNTGIYSPGNSKQAADMAVSGRTFEGNSYGIYATGGSYDIRQCEFKGGTRGIYVANFKLLNLSDSTFDGATYGLYATNGQLKTGKCTFAKNQYGLLFYDRGNPEPTIRDTSFSENTYALLFYYGSPQILGSHGLVFQNNQYALTGSSANLKLRDLALANNTTAVYCNRGTLAADACVLNGKTNGVLAYNLGTCELRNCQITGGTNWGVYANTDSQLVVDSCVISNGRHGLAIVHPGQNDVNAITNTTIEGNQQYGLYLTTPLDTVANQNLTIRNNGYGIISVGAALSLSPDLKINITGNGYGLYVRSADTLLDRFQLEGNNIGLLAQTGKVRCVAARLANTRMNLYLINNPEVEVTGCQLIGGSYASVYSRQASAATADYQIANTQVQDAGTYGIYWSNSSGRALKITDSSIRNGGGYGAYTSGLTTVTRTVVAQNKQYGIITVSGQLEVTGSTVDANGSWGIAGVRTTKNVLDRNQLRNNAGGVYLYDGENADVKNNLLAGGTYGMYLFVKSTGVQVWNNTLHNHSYYGIYQYRGPTVVRNCIISGCRYGIISSDNANLNQDYNLVHSNQLDYVRTSPGANNVHKPPRFENAGGLDLRLAKGSPAINAGVNAPGIADYDLVGVARPTHRQTEIGAYEYTPSDGSIRVLSWAERR